MADVGAENREKARALMATIDDGVVDGLMKGAVDLHVHSGPSTMARQLDHFQAVEQAAAAGMRGIMFKDHHYSVAPFLPIMERVLGHRASLPLLEALSTCACYSPSAISVLELVSATDGGRASLYSLATALSATSPPKADAEGSGGASDAPPRDARAEPPTSPPDSDSTAAASE